MGRLETLLALLLALSMVAATARAQDENAKIIRSNEITLPVKVAKRSDVTVTAGETNIDGFAELQDGKLVVNWPFSEDRKTFTIKVTAKGGGEELFSQAYQLAHSVIFDRLTFEKSVQSDVTFQAYGRKKPKPEDDNRTFVDHDFKAHAQAKAYRDELELEAYLEIVGTDRGDQAIRPGHRKIDMAKGYLATQGKSKKGSGRFAIGDVEVGLSNELIGTNMSSRGMSFDVKTLEERFNLRGGRIYGADIVGTQRGVIAYDTKNHRTSLDVSYKIPTNDILSLKVHGSYLDVERPAAENFNVGGVNNGETNLVVGGGFELGLFSERLRYVMSLAHSNYSNPENLNTDNEFAGSTDVSSTSGNGHKHRIDADIINGDDFKLTGYAGYSKVDPLYYSMLSLPAIDRETYEIGSSLTYRFVQFNVGTTIFENNIDDVPNILKTRQTSSFAKLDFAIGELRQNLKDEREEKKKPPLPGHWRYWPSVISLSFQEEKVKTLNAASVILNSSIDPTEMPLQVTRNFGLGLSWEWSFGNTEFGYTHSFQDNRNPGRNTADTVDDRIDISQDLTGDKWNASVRFGVGRTRNLETTSRSDDYRYEFGGTYAREFEKWPNLALGFDYGRGDTRYKVTGFSDKAIEWRINGGLDFSKYLPKQLAERNGYLRLAGFFQRNKQHSDEAGDSGDLAWALTFSMGLQF